MATVFGNRSQKILLISFLSGCVNSCAPQRPFKVTSGKNIIVFEGAIALGAAAELAERLDEDESRSIKALVITSAGGDSSEGIKIGKIVHAHRLNVRVRKYCNSACAQYIFVAGKDKYVDPGSIVSFHVSPIALYLELKYSGYINYIHPLYKIAALDISYYRDIGVDPNILVSGRKWLYPICVYADKNLPINSVRHYSVRWYYAGFILNSEDIQRAGVRNIHGFWPKSQSETDKTIRELPFRADFRVRYIDSTSSSTVTRKPTPLCGTED